MPPQPIEQDLAVNAHAPVEPASSVSNFPKKRRCFRRWAFRLLAVALSLHSLLLFEGLLRLFGVGHDVRLIVPADIDGTKLASFQFNPFVDLAYYGVTDLSGPEPRHFVLPKPPNTLRILVIGGSTVIGFPYPPELAFPRHLEVLLKSQQPGREVEVLNAGITAVNSAIEVEVLEQALRCQPDLVVVYTGHNEFYGPGGVGSRMSGLSPLLFRMAIAARSTRVGQLISAIISRRPVGNESLMESLPGDLEIPLDGPKFEEAVRRFRANIERMTKVSRDAHVPLLLVSPISNDRDQSPMRSLSTVGLTDEQVARFLDHLTTGEAQLRAGDANGALDQFQHAMELDAGYARLTYRRAQALQTLQKFDEATVAFKLARDQDGCRFRAPSRFAECLRDITTSANSPGVAFLDLTSAIKRQNEQFAFGHNHFFEHVHFTHAGHWAVARAIGESLTTRLLGQPWLTELVPSESDRDEALGVTEQDHLVADSLTLLTVNRPPLCFAPDYARQTAIWSTDLRHRLATLSAQEVQVFADLGMDAVQQDLMESLATRYRDVGQSDLEIAIWQRRIRRRPWLTEFYLNRAKSLGGPPERLADVERLTKRWQSAARGKP